MFKLSKKLELATQMNVTGKYSATDFQTTNYGLVFNVIKLFSFITDSEA